MRDRWVVLKGLLDTGDPDAMAAAVAERRFLAEVEHPNIVKIYNFVEHDAAPRLHRHGVRRRHVAASEILKRPATANGGSRDPLPVEQAIAYVLEILPALGYLHGRGLLYCDFKPDNVIQAATSSQAHRPRRRSAAIDDDDEPDLRHGRLPGARDRRDRADASPSDLYTVGRTLAVLVHRLPRLPEHRTSRSLPPGDQTPCSASYDSFYRLLLKACATDPADRFHSADEMAEQLLGVLREVVASGREGAAEHSTSSLLFDVPTVSDDSLDWQDLPRLRTDDSDPQMPWLRTVSIDDPVQRLAALEGAPAVSAEVLLARAHAALEAGQLERVDDAVRALLADDPWEWRAVWMSGLVALARRQTAEAQSAFNAVYGQVPGEARPEAGPGVRVRDGRRHRRRGVALRGVRPHRRQLHRPGGVRAGPDPRRSR